MLALHLRVVTAIWAAIEPRLPVVLDEHPLGCHRPKRVESAKSCFHRSLSQASVVAPFQAARSRAVSRRDPCTAWPGESLHPNGGTRIGLVAPALDPAMGTVVLERAAIAGPHRTGPPHVDGQGAVGDHQRRPIGEVVPAPPGAPRRVDARRGSRSGLDGVGSSGRPARRHRGDHSDHRRRRKAVRRFDRDDQHRLTLRRTFGEVVREFEGFQSVTVHYEDNGQQASARRGDLVRPRAPGGQGTLDP